MSASKIEVRDSQTAPAAVDQTPRLTRPAIEILLDPKLAAREQAQSDRWNRLAPTQVERTVDSGRLAVLNDRQSDLIINYPEVFLSHATILDFASVPPPN